MEVELGEITVALRRLRGGDDAALDEVVELLYRELRLAAHRQRGKLGGAAGFDTTALVNEAYIRLAKAEALKLEDREHFLAVASRAMRQVLIDEIRRRSRKRRGDAVEPLALGVVGDLPAAMSSPENWLDIDRALSELELEEPRWVRVLDCRVFGGLSDEETGVALGVSSRTVHRDWVKVKGWLALRLPALQP
ncbi:MAG: ECF-type sigma factor [Thermoanaerobaculia bacterium]